MSSGRRYRESEQYGVPRRYRVRTDSATRRNWARTRISRLIVDRITGKRATRWQRGTSEYRRAIVESLKSRKIRTHMRVYLRTDDAIRVGRILYRRK